MQDAREFLFFVAVSFSYAFLVQYLCWPRDKHNLQSFGFAAAFWFMPLLISAESVRLRAFASMLAIELFFKTVDIGRHRLITAEVPTLAKQLRYLIPFPPLLVVYADRVRFSGVKLIPKSICRIAIGGGITAIGFWLLNALVESPLLQRSFLLDHCIKLLMFVVTIEALAQAILGVEHLLGFQTEPFIKQMILSRSPAEFWTRYNTRVHRWFTVNFFKPYRHRPAFAVLIAFFVSAVFHEIMFAVATSRADGYQFAFFMLQAPAVLLSRKLDRLADRGWPGRLVAHGLTISWFALTSMLFFHGMARVFPEFYASKPWLP